MKTKKFIKNVEAKAIPYLALALFIGVFLSGIFLLPDSPLSKTVSADTAVTDFDYYKQITIDKDQVSGGSDFSFFTVPINISGDSDINGLAAEDFAFFASDQTTQLNHEIELYSDATDSLVAWVNVTTLSHDADTIIYMYYKDSDGTTEENVADTWHSSYTAVWLMDNASGGQEDSTTYGRDAVEGNSPTYQQTGSVGYCIDLQSADTDYFDIPNTFGHLDDGDTTVEIYYTFDTNTDDQVLFNFNGESFLVLGDYSDDIDWKWYDGSWHVAEVTPTVTTGVWNFVSCAYSQSSGGYTTINGLTGGTDADSGAINTGAADSTLGATSDPEKSVDGKIDFVAISNTARSIDYMITRSNSLRNCTSGGFYTIGAQQTQDQSSFEIKGLTNDRITWSGTADNSYWCNSSGDYYETLEINMTINASYNVTDIRVWVGDLNDSGSDITADNIELFVSSDNSSFGSAGSFSSGGSNISLNNSEWNDATMGSNPFSGAGLTDKTTSIYLRFKLSIPAAQTVDEYFGASATAWKIYLGYWT